MDEATAILGIVFMIVVVPLALILHYMTKWKSTKGLTDDEQRMLEDLWDDSERISDRLRALETILDEGSGEWRDRE
jgi:phage shock protein B